MTKYEKLNTFRRAQIIRVSRLVRQHKPVKKARKTLQWVTHEMMQIEVAKSPIGSATRGII